MIKIDNTTSKQQQLNDDNIATTVYVYFALLHKLIIPLNTNTQLKNVTFWK